MIHGGMKTEMNQTEFSVTSPSDPRPSEGGLSSEEARRRLADIGPNEPAPVQRTAGVVQFLRHFTNPLILILLFASVVSAFFLASGKRPCATSTSDSMRR